MIGWIKLHRQLIGWEWYSDSHTLHIFIHCILKANIEPGRFKGVEIPRGSFFTSILKISAETGVSIKAVRLSLNKLKKTGEISFTGASDGTMVTVCNYERYQANDTSEGQTKGVTRGKQRANEGSSKGTTIKEYNNKEEEELKNKETNINVCEHTPEEIAIFQKWISWIKENAPDINKLSEPLTIDQLLKLRESESVEMIQAVMMQMHNYKALKKYKSTYLTLKNWIKREKENKKPQKLTQDEIIRQGAERIRQGYAYGINDSGDSGI